MDDYELTFRIESLTADRTITLPDRDGTALLTSGALTDNEIPCVVLLSVASVDTLS